MTRVSTVTLPTDATKDDVIRQWQNQEVRKNNFPTEIIELPSKGKLYPTGHPLAEGRVEMRYMTARDEDILLSQNLIRQGTVLDTLLKNLIVTPFAYEDLLNGDKDALLIAARALGLGKDYAVQLTDPEQLSEEPIKINIDVTKLQAKPLHPITEAANGVNEFEFELPASRRKLRFHLPTVAVEQAIEKENKASQRIQANRNIDNRLSDRLKHVIISIDGDASPAAIRNFVDAEFFAVDSRAFRQYIASLAPGIDFNYTYQHPQSGNQYQLEVKLGIDFFWPGV
jgi:hypothetical protein